jgi:single-stranded DNA-binding protein
MHHQKTGVQERPATPRQQAPQEGNHLGNTIMAILATVEGNLTRDPEMRYVSVSGEQRPIVEIRVFADVNRQVDGQWEQDEERSSGVDVTIWAEKLGAGVLKTFKKGARVLVTGPLHLNQYQDNDGINRASLRMSGEQVALLPYRVEGVTFAARRREVDSPDGAGGAGSSAAAGGDRSGDTPF